MNALKYAAAAAVLVVAMQGCFGNKSTESGKENRNITSSSAADASSSESTAVPVPQSGSPSSVGVTSAAVRAVALSLPVTELPENNTTVASVEVAYSDGRKKLFTSGIAWIIGDPDVLEVKGTKLIARKEGSTTVRAKVGGKLSPQKTVTVYKLINGYRLPPEPDPEINNATLLGLDSNNNGVRDDVERLIILEEAKNIEYPKTQTAIKIQFANAWQKVIEGPVIENNIYLENASECQRYFFSKKTKNIKGYLNRREWRKSHYGILGNELEDKIFNTEERIQQRFKFLEACSGNIFDLKVPQLSACQINIDKLGE